MDGGISAATAAPKRISETDQEMAQLFKNTDLLESLCGALGNRLEKYLRSDPDEAKSAGIDGPTPSSQFSKELNALNIRLYRLCSGLGKISSRLEI